MIDHSNAIYDEVLTKRAVALLEDRMDFAVKAQGAIPMIGTTALTGNYKVWKAGDMRRRNMADRASGADFKRVNLNVEKKTFALGQKGYEIAIDDRENMEGEMQSTALKMVEDSYAEFDMALAALCTSTYMTNAKTGQDNNPGNNQFLKWSVATSTPITDVKKYVNEIKGKIGVKPDSILLSEDVFTALTENAQILGRLATTADKNLTAEKLAFFFGIKNVYISAGAKTTSADGQTDTFGDISTGVAVIYYRGTADGPSNPSAIKCFYNTNEGNGDTIIETYRDERKRSDVARVICDFDMKVTMPEGCILLTSVL